MPTIPEDLVGDFPGPGAVDEHPPCRHPIDLPPPLAVESQDVPVLGHHHRRFWADGRSHAGMPGKLAILTVYRHEVARPDQGNE